MSAFEGTHPTLRQSPPIRCFSTIATFAPRPAAPIAVTSPAGPSSNDLTGHAEVLACQDAVNKTGSKRLDGTTLYTTAEPCFMCSYVIRQSGIALVVYGIETPLIGGVTSSMPILTDAGLSSWGKPPAVIDGFLLDECRALRNLTSG